MTETEFARLVQLLRGNIFRLSFCYMKSRADAEDVTQDAFLKLYCREVGFDSDEEAKAWLIRVTINRCKDVLRSHWYRFSEPITPACEEISAFETDGNTAVLNAVMKMKPKNRTALYMYYYEDYSVKEIARLLAVRESTVTTRLSRGRQELKGLLIQEGYDEKEL